MSRVTRSEAACRLLRLESWEGLDEAVPIHRHEEWVEGEWRHFDLGTSREILVSRRDKAEPKP